jgi:hypothetical protein
MRDAGALVSRIYITLAQPIKESNIVKSQGLALNKSRGADSEQVNQARNRRYKNDK